MKTAINLLQEKKTFKLTDEEFVKAVQLDAYNSAVRDVWKNATLEDNEGKPLSKMYSVHSPTRGQMTITISEKSVLGLIKDQ